VLVLYVLSSLSQTRISKIRSDKLLVLELTSRSISDHPCVRQPTMQYTISAWQHTNPGPKQSFDFLPCLLLPYSPSLYTHLLYLTSTLCTPQRKPFLKLLASYIQINPTYLISRYKTRFHQLRDNGPGKVRHYYAILIQER